jgi:inner membrane protein
MAWWAWIIAGFVLLVIELATPGGFYFLFFGLGAGTIGLAKLLGFSGPPWLEWLLFTLVSVTSLGLFRRRLLVRFTARGLSVPDDVDQMVGLSAIATDIIPPGAEGKVQMRGATWSARNLGSEPIVPGQQCTVQKMDGLVLCVRPTSSAVVEV